MTEKEEVYALSPVQQTMLYYHLLDPDSGVNILQVTGHIREELDIPAFERAWQHVTNLLPVLRTSFEWEGRDHPVQVVSSSVEVRIEIEDLQSVPPQAQQTRLRQRTEDERRLGFDLSCRPLSRVALLRFAPRDFRLIWTTHHILLDGVALSLVLGDVFKAYDANLEGHLIQLEPRRPFRDYVAWLEGLDVKEAELFWRKRLGGLESSTLVATGRRNTPLVCTIEDFHVLGARLSPHLTGQLRACADELGVTVKTFVEGAWAILLSRYLNTRDVLYGAARACRHFGPDSVATIPGTLVNLHPVRVRIARHGAVSALLRDIRESNVLVRRFEHVSLDRIQAWSERPGGGGLFDTVINWENRSKEEMLEESCGRPGVRTFHVHTQTNFPLSLKGILADELELTLSYYESCFPKAAIRRILRHLETILTAFVHDPQQPISQVPMLSDDERRDLTTTSSRTIPHNGTLHGLFESKVGCGPDRIAVSSGCIQVTYRELNARANQLAHHLRGLGVGPEVQVGLCLGRSVELVVGVLGVLKAGAPYVPLDPTYPEARLGLLIEESGAPLIVTSAECEDRVPDTRAIVVVLGDDEVIEQHPVEAPISTTTSNDLACVLFTSGSTGKPKGVCLSHRAVTNALDEFHRRQQIKIGDVVSHWTAFSFDVSIYEMFSALGYGATLDIVPDEVRSDGGAFVDWLIDRAVTAAYVPAFFLEDLARAAKRTPGACQLQRMLVGVEPIDQEKLDPLFGYLPGLEITNGYGPTEATICATLHSVSPNAPGGRVPIGRAIANCRVLLLDDQLELVPVGVCGEVYVGGAGLAQGYHGLSGETALSFLPDPFAEAPGSRLYRTGDLARWKEDGTIEFLGRRDDQVKLRGFRIEPAEVTAILLDHPGVTDAVVVVSKDVGPRRLVAYVTGRESLSPSGIRNFLGQRLPDYMIPTAFVILPRIPRGSHGKVDRQALPAPDSSRPDSMATYEPPKTETEKLVANIWRRVLGIDRVGIHDNFFDLGGDSLLLVNILSQLAPQVDRPLTIVDLLRHQSVFALASVLSGGESPDTAHLDAASSRGRLRREHRRRRHRGLESPED